MTDELYLRLGRAVIKTEAEAIAALTDSIDHNFAKACAYLFDCKGRIVVTGMGKSGHIGCKIAATLASTGSPAFFVHPGEASHGDLGMITFQDVVLAISNSGETDEITTIVPIIKRLNVPLITMTGNHESTLALEANVNLNVAVKQEACPLGLAPTSSTTATLVMGDALAIALLEARGFTEEDFARSHPGGRLGRRLLLLIEDIMHSGDEIPVVQSSASIREALHEITRKGMGMTAVVSDENKVQGIFTDGDLRRILDTDTDINATAINDVMTPGCKTANQHILAAEALQILQSHKINGLLIVNHDNVLKGAINMHDLLRAGVV